MSTVSELLLLTSEGGTEFVWPACRVTVMVTLHTVSRGLAAGHIPLLFDWVVLELG